jgi:hypothetical protein
VSLCYRITFNTDSVSANPSLPSKEIRNLLVFPNPAVQGFVELTIAAQGRHLISESEKVEIIGMRGEVIVDENFVTHPGKTTFNIGKDLKPGVYIIRVTTHEDRLIQRLIVE